MNTSKLLDVITAYRLVKLIATPYEDSRPYKMGIIDKNGERIKANLTSEDKNYYNILFICASNIKKLLKKFPKFVSAYGIYQLLKEDNLVSNELKSYLKEAKLDKVDFSEVSMLCEDVAVNNSGSGQAQTLTEPFKKPKAEKYYDAEIFEVPHDIYKNCSTYRKPYERWKKFISHPDYEMPIKEYCSRNKNKSILLRSEETGEFVLLRPASIF